VPKGAALSGTVEGDRGDLVVVVEIEVEVDGVQGLAEVKCRGNGSRSFIGGWKRLPAFF